MTSTESVTHASAARSNLLTLLCAATLIAAIAALTMLGDLLVRFDAYAAIAICATVMLLGVLWLFDRRSTHVSARSVIVVAVLLRVAALPMQPSLSDDVWRYLWDGRLVLSGINPYTVAPSDPSLARYRDHLYELQGHPETATVYPPLAQALFAVAAVPGSSFDRHLSSYYLLKLMLAAIEIGAIVAMLKLLAAKGRPARDAMLYAWHPLVVIELAGQGHLDGLWVASIIFALWAYARAGGAREDVVAGGRAPSDGRGGADRLTDSSSAAAIPAGSASASSIAMHGGDAAVSTPSLRAYIRQSAAVMSLVAGAAARMYPAALLPLWWRATGTRTLARSLLLSLPFALLAIPLVEPGALASLIAVVSRFTNYYEFNGGFYYAVKAAADALALTPSNRIAGFISIIVQAGVLIVATLSVKRNASIASLASAALLVTSASAALGAKAHVWYFAAPLALVALCPRSPMSAAWLWLSLVAPLTYAAYSTVPVAESTVLLCVEWGGAALVGAWLWWRQRGTA